eukprot:CAMPEP_0183741448 /NCGR_PEP_ID=MMETSP0737-20130205/62142_1 /TAXON_ID=385413 /ORGANISM="Thalassiosira miniscula, Strain CCMP1093" /LENGTH=492 /DNA_ID=CAMNT_0025976777 /DNA_START=337 /DNA_END=1815 /DNA_ORIENTATION=+
MASRSKSLRQGATKVHPNNSNKDDKSTGSANSDSAIAAEEYKKKIKRKMQMEARSKSMRSVAFEERRHRNLVGDRRKPSMRSTSMTLDAKTYEEKIRRKLEAENSLTASPKSVNSTFEERLKRKLSNDRATRQTSNIASSLPTKLMSASRDVLFDQSTSKINDSVGGGDCSTEPVEQVSYFGSSHVCFDDLFTDLKRFKEENGNLRIPVTHPSFVSIMDAFSSFGMEELLKKRWDYQLAGLKAFKREHGDCLIPATHPTLGKWVRIQSNHYKLHKQRLPAGLSKKRLEKLENIGFDKFLSWEEGNKTDGNVSREEHQENDIAATSEKVEASDDGEVAPPNGLTLDQKIGKLRMKKKRNKKKLVEAGLKPPSSTKRRPGKKEVAAELREKRLLRRSLRPTVRRTVSNEAIRKATEKHNGGEEVHKHKGTPRSVSTRSSLGHSSSVASDISNLTPMTRDGNDAGINSWGELNDVLAMVADLSLAGHNSNECIYA